ncbi:uncharacterized protein H6S33_005729 [Morchella sextelata]|uniref:uncharacterized protein n=1 Tax=Morchella sextelata TaxID=1174677 RepID=UPI001D05A3A2|nr:uncharacterized protein H6S33_005729 [Morchella sextelata]KAH0613843.1 hypothetical protein H6S33_005729 [Morchella sextelata]
MPEGKNFFNLSSRKEVVFEEIEPTKQVESRAMINHSNSPVKSSPTSPPKTHLIEPAASPRVNVYDGTPPGQGEPYYLPEGAVIEFFLHDKPIEFYGQCACLVRNIDIPGLYAIRVPAEIDLYAAIGLRQMFESRLSVKAREELYLKNGPYVKEREVGVNCGTHDYPLNTNYEMFTHGQLQQPQSEPGSSYATPARGGEIDYYRPTDPQNFAVYPEMLERPDPFVDATSSVASSSPVGSDQGARGSSFVYRENNEFYPSNGGRTYNESAADLELQSATDRKTDLRVNSGGYVRMMFPAVEKPLEPVYDQPISPARRFNPQQREHFDGMYDENDRRVTHMAQNVQHGPLIMVPTRPAAENPASLPPRHLNKKTNALYKTEMCRNWNEIGECRYGRSCQFAHGKKELRIVPRHGQWKTKTCMAWLHGGCTYGSRCCYAHEIIDGDGHPLPGGNSVDQVATPAPENGESRFSDFFASRCWT